VLLEASTESEWVARHLEALGHTVFVADPNYAPMYATRARRVKTDCRDALVRTRTRYIALAKSLVRRDGLRVAGSESERVAERIAALELSPTLAGELAPLFALLAPLNAEIAAAEQRIAPLTAADPVVALLTTASGVGPITASALVATIDDVARFRSAHEFEAYLGVVPGERNSGEKRRVGRITRRETRACGGWWSRRRGGSCARGARRQPRCGRGRPASRRAAASGSPSWRSRAGWRASCTRCGVTAWRTTGGRSARRARGWHPSPNVEDRVDSR
jgi:transposase